MNDKHSNFTSSHDDLEPQLESAVWAVLSEPLPADAIARVKAQALTLENEARRSVRTSNPLTFWNRPWIKLATLAACIFLVLGATMMFPSSSNAFAQAIERLKNAGAFRYKELLYVTTQEKPIEIEVLVADDGRERKTMLGRVSIHDSSGQLRLAFDEANKSATVHEPMFSLLDESDRQIKWLERLKSYGKKPDKELGTMKIEGRDCLGFEVKITPSAVFAVWVDEKTNDLVQVEFMGMPKGSTVTKSVMKDFEFNVSLDPTLFSFDAPMGFESTIAAKLPELLPFEESLIEALKGYTDLSGGKFPKSISDWGEWVVLMAESDIAKEKMTTISGRLGTLLPYLTFMPKDDYDYTGAGKAVSGKRAIVFWYRNPEKQLRAVFSDFTISSISETELVEVK